MPAWDERAARVSLTALGVCLSLLVIYLIRRTLLIFICAVLLAYLLSPLVDVVDRFTRRFPRNTALALVYVALLGLVGFFVATVGSRIAEEATSLAARLPQYLRNPQSFPQLPLPAWMEPYKARALETLVGQLESNAQEILPALGKAGQRLLAAFGNLVFVLLVPILSFFFLKDGKHLRQLLLAQFSAATRRTADDVLADINLMLAQFMRALVLLSLVTFVAYWIFLAVAGAPYPLLLAGIAGALEFVPVAGPLIAAAVILAVAGFAGFPHLLWILIFLIAFRLFQDYVVQPYLLGSGLELPPAAVIFGVLAGEQIGGVMGMFLSIPALATLRVLYVRLVKSRGRQPAGA